MRGRELSGHGSISGFVLEDDSQRLSYTGDRVDLTALARAGSAEYRLARRANAFALLDDGSSCAGRQGAASGRRQIPNCKIIEDGLEALTRFQAGGTALPVERRVNRQDGRLRKGEFAPLPTPDRRFYLVGVWRRV